MDCFRFLNCLLLKNNFEEPSDVSLSMYVPRQYKKYKKILGSVYGNIVCDLGTIVDAFILTEVNINEEMTTLFSIPG